MLEGALGIVQAFDTNRLPKDDFAYEVEEAPRIKIHNVPSDKREASVIRAIVEGAVPEQDVLILVPGRRYASLIADRLRRARIRFATAEPPPGEGLPLLNRLGSWLSDNSYSLALRDCIEAFLEAEASGVPSKKVRMPEKVSAREAAFLAVSKLWEKVLAEKVSLWESLEANAAGDVLLRTKNLFGGLREHDKKQVAAFLKQVVGALEPWSSTSILLEELEGWVAKAVVSEGEADVNVRIMTFQGAKGLEADVVCVVGLEDETIPRKGATGEQLAEQARLLYVSMTRAKKALHLFHARTRSGAVSFKAIHSAAGPHVLEPSPFLAAIKEEHRELRYHPSKTS